jgi:phosphoserine phosphatase RsbU/P
LYEAQIMARLEIVTGGHTGKVFDFTDEVRLGRSPDNDFCLPDTLVSRYHARITRNGPHFILEDLNSLNGTSRRGTRLPPATPCLLASGDAFEIGSMRIVFYDQSLQEPLRDQVPVANLTGGQAGQTIPPGVRPGEALSLR